MGNFNRIKDVLKNQGRSQIWLADKLGKTKTSMNAICNNVSQPSLETLYQVATILEVDVCDLLVREQDGNDKTP